MKTKITTILFDDGLGIRWIPSLRATIASAFMEKSIYHNHTADKIIYRYPPIQYKEICGKAAVVGIGEGAESLENDFHYNDTISISIDGKEKSLTVVELSTYEYTPESFADLHQEYIIKNWLPFNQENFARYLNATTLVEKVSLLEKVLSANILSLFTGFGYYSENKSNASILDIMDSRYIMYKGVKMASFDVKIKCNATLPQYCGIGKGVSRGFGTVYRV